MEKVKKTYFPVFFQNTQCKHAIFAYLHCIFRHHLVLKKEQILFLNHRNQLAISEINLIRTRRTSSSV